MFALQELVGWECAEMVRRCADLAANHLAPYAAMLGAVRAGEAQIDGTDSSQRLKKKERACISASP